MPFLPPNQQRQSTNDANINWKNLSSPVACITLTGLTEDVTPVHAGCCVQISTNLRYKIIIFLAKLGCRIILELYCRLLDASKIGVTMAVTIADIVLRNYGVMSCKWNIDSICVLIYACDISYANARDADLVYLLLWWFYTWFLVITSGNVDWFSNFLHWLCFQNDSLIFSSFLPQILISCNKNFSKYALLNKLLK